MLIKKLHLTHLYYITRFYSFLKNTSIKGSSAIVFFGAIQLELNVLHFSTLPGTLATTNNPQITCIFFLPFKISLGIVPLKIVMHNF